MTTRNALYNMLWFATGMKRMHIKASFEALFHMTDLQLASETIRLHADDNIEALETWCPPVSNIIPLHNNKDQISERTI